MRSFRLIPAVEGIRRSRRNVKRMKGRTTVAVLCELRSKTRGVRSLFRFGEEEVEENLANDWRIFSRDRTNKFGW